MGLGAELQLLEVLGDLLEAVGDYLLMVFGDVRVKLLTYERIFVVLN